MKRTLAVIIVGILCLSIFSTLNFVSGDISSITSAASSLTTTLPKMRANFYASDPTFPWVGVGVNLFTNGSVQYVSCSDYVYVSHGWEAENWSSYPLPAQNAFLDPAQNNFTLETNASGFANPPLTQFTYYNSTGDTMSSFFWLQFYPGDLAPGAYSFTGTWQEDAAADFPNYTAIYIQNTITLVVSSSNSTTSISLSPNLVSVDQTANCSVTVSGLNATGTINWTASSSTGYFSQPVCTLSSGRCSTAYTDNNTGYVTIIASYSGDSYNLPSSGNTTLTVYVNVTTGTNVTVTPTDSLELTFANITVAGTVVANATPTVQAPNLVTVGAYYNINVTISFSGNVTVSLAFDGSNMTDEQKSSLTMMQYTPIVGDVQPQFGVVNMKDVAYIARHFGTNPTSPNWDPVCDLNGDGKVDMKDIALVARHFGFTANWVNITTYVDTTNNIIYGITSHFSFISIHG